MTNLALVKSENFGDVTCDFWKDEVGNMYIKRKQIGEALEYSDAQKAIDNLHQKHKDRMDNFSVTLDVRGTDGKLYNTQLYTSKGIYEICRFSRQPKADKFMDWVWDILEQIRLTGGYIPIKENDSDAEIMAKALLVAQRTLENKDKIIEELKPKAENYDKFLNGNNYQSMNDVAKVVGIGRNKLFDFLRRNGILMADNVPYERYIKSGYFSVKESVIEKGNSIINCATTYVTAKGVEWIEKLLTTKISNFSTR